MNAYELADELKKCIKDGSTDLVCVEQAATMLRQQQAEIENLKLKKLTNEEIRTIQAICHLKDVGYDNFIMRFARAILKKAQNK